MDSAAGPGKGLPSFLSSIPRRAREPNVRDSRAPSVGFIGAIFFGGTEQCHPRPHSVALSPHFARLVEIQSKENIWDNLFQDVSPVIKTYPGRRKIRLVRERPGFVDAWPHRAPGVRVVAGRSLRRFVPNFGISTSKITGTTIREILDQIPVDSPTRLCQREFQRERKRFLLEKNRKFLLPEKRAAHFHFPKEFADVTIIGPPIPASITVTRLGIAEDEEGEDEDEESAGELGEMIEKLQEQEHVDLGDDMEESEEDAFEDWNDHEDDT